VAQYRVQAAPNYDHGLVAGVFAALWALINGLVYVFYKRSEFTSCADHDESRLSLGYLGVRRHHPPPSTPFIARLVSCA
jgi:hypothetical protein